MCKFRNKKLDRQIIIDFFIQIITNTTKHTYMCIDIHVYNLIYKARNMYIFQCIFIYVYMILDYYLIQKIRRNADEMGDNKIFIYIDKYDNINIDNLKNG